MTNGVKKNYNGHCYKSGMFFTDKYSIFKHITEGSHRFFSRYRHTFPMVFFVSILIAFFSTQIVLANTAIVEAVETKIVLTVDGETREFVTIRNTVQGAITEAGIELRENDVAIPDLESTLKGGEEKITLIRALPVLISDNNQQFLAYSAYSEPLEIIRQLKIELYPEDRINTELIIDPVDDQAVGQKVIITRAPIYTVLVDGERRELRSWGETIGAVLADKVALGQRDIIKPGLAESSAGISEIVVTRVNIVEVEETPVIPYQTEYRQDYNLYIGQSKTLVKGENGQKQQKVRIVYQNGLEVQRTVLSVIVIKPMVKEVVIKGVKPYNAGVWWETIVAAGLRWGVDPVSMYKVMICESGGNPYAGTYYKGLYQYALDTWSGASAAYPGGVYRGAAITDGTAQIYVTAWKVSLNGWSAWGCKP